MNIFKKLSFKMKSAVQAKQYNKDKQDKDKVSKDFVYFYLCIEELRNILEKEKDTLIPKSYYSHIISELKDDVDEYQKMIDDETFETYCKTNHLQYECMKNYIEFFNSYDELVEKHNAEILKEEDSL